MVLAIAASACGWSAGAQDAKQQPSANDQKTSQQQQQPPAPPVQNGSAKKKPSTAQDNPFPEDVSRKAAAEANSETAPDAPAPEAAKPPPAAPDMKPNTAETPRKKLKLEPPDSGLGEYNPKQAAEDDRVGTFYLQNGDYRGAYNRFKEAATVNPEDAQAVWGLAESARKLNMTKEAIQNYHVYLDAFPGGPKAKQARKALSELGASAKSN